MSPESIVSPAEVISQEVPEGALNQNEFLQHRPLAFRPSNVDPLSPEPTYLSPNSSIRTIRVHVFVATTIEILLNGNFWKPT